MVALRARAARARAIGAAVATLVLACPSRQRADFEAFCDAHRRAGVLASDSPGEQALKISRYLAQELTTEEAKAVLRSLPTLEPSRKRGALSAAAANWGVAPCPLADLTWPTTDAGLQP